MVCTDEIREIVFEDGTFEHLDGESGDEDDDMLVFVDEGVVEVTDSPRSQFKLSTLEKYKKITFFLVAKFILYVARNYEFLD